MPLLARSETVTMPMRIAFMVRGPSPGSVVLCRYATRPAGRGPFGSPQRRYAAMRYAGRFAVAGLALAAALPALAFPPAPAGGGDQKIVFTSFDIANKKVAIGIMNADGSKRTLLGKGEAFEVDPALSPDGKRVAFVSINEKEKKSGLWAMNTDGSDRKRLLDMPEGTL